MASRTRYLFVLLLAAVIGLGCPAPDVSLPLPHPDPPYHHDIEQAVFEAINAERRTRGLRALDSNGELDSIARSHSAYLYRIGRLSHRDGEGSEVEGRLEANGVSWHVAGENVARNRGFRDPAAEAVRGWMASPGHRANILAPEYRETGVGVVYHRESGYYYFTQVFLRRRRE